MNHTIAQDASNSTTQNPARRRRPNLTIELPPRIAFVHKQPQVRPPVDKQVQVTKLQVPAGNSSNEVSTPINDSSYVPTFKDPNPFTEDELAYLEEQKLGLDIMQRRQSPNDYFGYYRRPRTTRTQHRASRFRARLLKTSSYDGTFSRVRPPLLESPRGTVYSELPMAWLTADEAFMIYASRRRGVLERKDRTSLAGELGRELTFDIRFEYWILVSKDEEELEELESWRRRKASRD